MAANFPENSRPEPGGKGDTRVPVTVEPKEGRSDQQVATTLRNAGASEVEASHRVSYQPASPSRSSNNSAIAEVHLKVRKQMH